jgi:hypothetical protein
MEADRRKLLEQNRASCKASLTGLQTFVDSFDLSFYTKSELKVRYDSFGSIWDSYVVYQEELEFDDDQQDHASDRDLFESQYFSVRARYLDLIESTTANKLEVNVETTHTVSSNLKSRISDYTTTIDSAVLPSITCTMPATYMEYGSWGISNDMVLADEHFNVPSGIDPPIEAQVFDEVLRPEKPTNPGHYPILQVTEFGWTVAGNTPLSSPAQTPQRVHFVRRDISLDSQDRADNVSTLGLLWDPSTDEFRMKSGIPSPPSDTPDQARAAVSQVIKRRVQSTPASIFEPLGLALSESISWTDSTLVLHWLSSSASKCEAFVGNHVATIHEPTSRVQKKHVPSASNPADLISRGLYATTLKACKLWWHGPDWLIQELSSWPTFKIRPPVTYNLEETGDTCCNAKRARELNTAVFYTSQNTSNCVLPKVSKVDLQSKSRQDHRHVSAFSTRN